MNKRRFWLLLSLLVILSLAAVACQPAAVEEEEPAAEEEEEAPPPAEEEEAEEEMAEEEEMEEEEPMEEEAMVYGTEDNPIRFGFVPSEESEVIVAGAEDIAALVEEASGLVVEPFVTTSYSGLIEAMCNEEAEVGALATFSYVLAAQRECADVGLVSVRFGAPFYKGQLIARADSGIESFEDLVGKTFCRPDPLSTSGWIIPSIAMRAAGVDPDTDLAEVVDADGHTGVVIAVYNGECDAGSTFVDARGGAEEEFPDVLDVVSVIAESAEIPNDTVSYAPHLDEETAAAFTAAMIAITSDEANAELLDSVYEWDTLQETDDSFFDGFRQQLDAAGVNIEDLQ